jgi:hypothetical protein
LTIPADWNAISVRGQSILRLIAIPISQGYTAREVGLELGTTPSWVSNRLHELADEITRLTD